MSWGEIRYRVVIPPEGRVVKVLEMGEDEAKGRGKKVVYTFEEEQEEGGEDKLQHAKKNMLILEIENYLPGHFTLIKRGGGTY